MYNTSQNYKNYIKEPSRMFESKIILGSRTLNNNDVIQLKTELQQPSNGFTLGSCISKSLELTLKNDSGTYASAGVLDVSLGLKMGELIEYIPQGLFNIDTVEKTDYTVKITAYDNMIKFETAYSEKYDNPTLKQVIQQLQTITGVEFDSSVTIPSYTLSKLSGYTCREILSYAASLMGGNAYITRDGKFTIVTPVEVDYTITADNYFDYDIEDNTYKIGMLTCQNKLKNDAVDESDDYEAIEEKNTISAGSLGTDNMELTFINPWMTETILNSIYNKLKTFSFLGYSIKWQGDLSIDVGNIINVTDRHGVTRKALVFSDKINYNGGLTQETGAKGQTKSSNEFSTIESPTELDRISVKVLLAEKAIIQKANITDLTAVSAKVGTLDASIANINTALINYAKVDDLNATNANISNLNAQYSNLNNALINKADIAKLNAANANISKLQATVADISTLVSGNLTSANIHSLVLTADKVTVQNGFIKNAMVESLVADKITSGTLNTNKLNIASNDGGLVLANNTIQFSDKDKNVRVQIGQDTKGDFNFIVKGTDGRTVLLDSTGLHEGAISDGLIKTDMIADNSINSNKIDYSSVISGLNADGSNYINASKVAIDLTGQSLDVAFNSVKSTADSANSKIDNLNVGGRNLLRGTKKFLIDSNRKNGWYNGNNMTIVSDTGEDCYIASISASDKTSIAHLSMYSNYVPVNLIGQGKNFVVSMYVKVDSVEAWDIKVPFIFELYDETRRIGWRDVDISLTSVTYEPFSDGKWSKVIYSSKLSDNKFSWLSGKSINDVVKIGVRICLPRNGTIYFKKCKLEKGDIATDWTLAQEDTEEEISEVKTITEANTTSISAIQGQISTLISNATVTVDGKEKTLKDAYNGTVQTVNSINTTIGEHTSTLNTLNGTVSSNSSKITSIQTDLNGVKTSVSSVQSDLNFTKSQLSSLSTTLDGFESRVEATESNLSNLSVGGRNLLRATKNFLIDNNRKNGWYNGNNMTIVSDTGEDCYIASISASDKTSIAHLSMYSNYVPVNLIGQGKNFVVSMYVKVDSVEAWDIKVPFIFELYDETRRIGWRDVDISLTSVTYEPFSDGKWSKVIYSSKLSDNKFSWLSGKSINDVVKIGVRICLPRNGTIYFKKCKLEKGNIATDWAPAAEDLEAYTDTQIFNVKSEIKQTTDSILQSVSNVNSSITTINNTLGNKAEKSTVENISNSVTSLNTSLSGITGRLSSLEINTTTLTTKLNDLRIGGRNYIKGGKGDKKRNFFKNFAAVNNGYGEHRLTSKKTYASLYLTDGFVLDCRDYDVGEKYIMSYDFMYTEWNFPEGTDRKEFWIGQRYTGAVGSGTNGAWRSVTGHSLPKIGEDGCELNKWIRIKKVITIPQQAYAGIGSEAKIQFYNSSESASASITFRIKNVKIEKGEIATDWTPAPEDVENEITTVQETVTSNTTEISALKNSISLKVDSTEMTSYKETVNGQLNTINSSITSMKSSIDLNTRAITSKVSANDVGTIITQNPTSVMTAFNKISQYFEVSASGAKFGNISTGDYMAFNDRGLVRYIANQEKRYIYMVQPRTFTKTLNNQTPALTSAQSSVGKTKNWNDIKNNMPKAKDYAQTFTLTFDNELINLLSGYAPQYVIKLSAGSTSPSNLSYSGSQNGVVGEDYITDTYIEVVSMTSTSITFKAAEICCVYEVTVDKTGIIKYYQYKRNYAGGAITWDGLLFA